MPGLRSVPEGFNLQTGLKLSVLTQLAVSTSIGTRLDDFASALGSIGKLNESETKRRLARHISVITWGR